MTITFHWYFNGTIYLKVYDPRPDQAFAILNILEPKHHPSYEEFIKRWTDKDDQTKRST